jgi:prepilin-type N-terminal cleavage/methylation domain-containing protein
MLAPFADDPGGRAVVAGPLAAERSRTVRAAMPLRRRAFTLVELLVVIAIIGILMALVVPAVQAVRGTGQRTACGNNLHQMGIALQAYHSVHERFPTGCIEPVSKMPGGRQLAWSAFLLPHLDQQPLHHQVNFDLSYNAQANAAAAATVVAVYICPSCPAGGSNLVGGLARCDYGGMYGEAIRPLPTDGSWHADNGTMLYDKAICLCDIVDGATYTLIVAENSQKPSGQWINGLNIFDQKYAINYVPANSFLWEDEMRSNHAGGANSVFCDGAVHFLSETMDLKTLKAVCTRAGGEPVSGL